MLTLSSWIKDRRQICFWNRFIIITIIIIVIVYFEMFIAKLKVSHSFEYGED